MKTISRMMVAVMAVFTLGMFGMPREAQAQEAKVYEPGTVWNITFIRTHANMGEDYLKGITKTWKASMDGLVKEGVIKSFKILYGDAFGASDFDIMLMVEYPNFAAMDPNPVMEAKSAAVEKRIKDGMGESYDKTIVNYTNLRDILGSKTFREIYLK